MTTETGLSTQLASSDVDRLVEPWWTCFAAMHWGFRSHAAVYWCCHGEVSASRARMVLGTNVNYPLRVIVFYRELVADLVPERELAQRIVDATPKAERSHLSRFYAGSNAFTKGDGSTRPIHRIIDEITVPSGMPRLRLTDDGANSSTATSRMIDDGLRRTLSVRGHNPPAVAIDAPLLLISSECPKLVSTLPRLGFDPKHREDVVDTGTFRDAVWAACCNAYRDYPSVVSGKPVDVLRMEAINRSDDPTQRHLNHLEFDSRILDDRRPRKF